MEYATKYVPGLRYKLRTMGIHVEGCTYIYGDNQSVLANTMEPHSQLKKESNTVAYHHCREGSALDEWRTAYTNTHDNLSDILTNSLPTVEERNKFCKHLLHYLITEEKLGESAVAAAAVRVPL